MSFDRSHPTNCQLMNGNRNSQSQIHYLSASAVQWFMADDDADIYSQSLNISIGFCSAPPIGNLLLLLLNPSHPPTRNNHWIFNWKSNPPTHTISISPQSTQPARTQVEWMVVVEAFSNNCVSVWILSSLVLARSLSPEQQSLNYWAVLNGGPIHRTGRIDRTLDRIVLLFDDYKHRMHALAHRRYSRGSPMGIRRIAWGRQWTDLP